ncbi:hypothetical protein Hokovirus_3_18 [Hokovirus HKV1]|uniref:DUF3638 domain-containing protein n=1 Tax=Hokovirus HKV1 TaxID=1977638 RepID=A0A1V0SG94_9VIRU|nr:hypothetical protein Hokovirus_3_18 [Hokovirus HKV1]
MPIINNSAIKLLEKYDLMTTNFQVYISDNYNLSLENNYDLVIIINITNETNEIIDNNTHIQINSTLDNINNNLEQVIQIELTSKYQGFITGLNNNTEKIFKTLNKSAMHELYDYYLPSNYTNNMAVAINYFTDILYEKNRDLGRIFNRCSMDYETIQLLNTDTIHGNTDYLSNQIYNITNKNTIRMASENIIPNFINKINTHAKKIINKNNSNSIWLLPGGYVDDVNGAHMIVYCIEKNYVTMINSGNGVNHFDYSIVVQQYMDDDKLLLFICMVIFYLRVQFATSEMYFIGETNKTIENIKYSDLIKKFNVKYFFNDYKILTNNNYKYQISGSCTYYSLYYASIYCLESLNRSDEIIELKKYYKETALNIIDNDMNTINYPYESKLWHKQKKDYERDNYYNKGLIFKIDFTNKKLNKKSNEIEINTNNIFNLIDILSEQKNNTNNYLAYEYVKIYFTKLIKDKNNYVEYSENIKYGSLILQIMQRDILNMDSLIDIKRRKYVIPKGDKKNIKAKEKLLYRIHEQYMTLSLILTLYIVKLDLIEIIKKGDLDLELKKNTIASLCIDNFTKYILNDQDFKLVLNNYELFFREIYVKSSGNSLLIDHTELYTYKKNIPDDNLIESINYIICNSFYKYIDNGNREIFIDPNYKPKFNNIEFRKIYINMNRTNYIYYNFVNIIISMKYIRKNIINKKITNMKIIEFDKVNTLIYDLKTLLYFLNFNKPLFKNDLYDPNTSLFYNEGHNQINFYQKYINNYNYNKKIIKKNISNTINFNKMNKYALIYVIYVINYYSNVKNYQNILNEILTNNVLDKELTYIYNFLLASDINNSILENYFNEDETLQLSLLDFMIYFINITEYKYLNTISYLFKETTNIQRNVNNLLIKLNKFDYLTFNTNYVEMESERIYNIYESSNEENNIFLSNNIIIYENDNKIITANTNLLNYVNNIYLNKKQESMIYIKLEGIDYALLYNIPDYFNNYPNKLMYSNEENIILDIFSNMEYDNSHLCRILLKNTNYGYKFIKFNSDDIFVPNKLFAMWINSIPYCFMTKNINGEYDIYLIDVIENLNTNLHKKIYDTCWLKKQNKKKYMDFINNLNIKKPETRIEKIKVKYNGTGLIFNNSNSLITYAIYCILYQKEKCLNLIFDQVINELNNVSNTINYQILNYIFTNKLFNVPHKSYYAYRYDKQNLNSYKHRENYFSNKYKYNKYELNTEYNIFTDIKIPELDYLCIENVKNNEGLDYKNLNDIAKTNIYDYFKEYRSCTLRCNKKIKNIDMSNIKNKYFNIIYDKIIDDDEHINQIILSNVKIFYNLLEIKSINNVINSINYIIEYQPDCIELKKIHDQIDLNILYTETRNRIDTILFEINFGYFIRKKQMNLINNILNELKGNSSYNVYQMLMGSGKTSVIMPYLLYHYIYDYNFKKCITLVMPNHLIKDFYNNLVSIHNLGIYDCHVNIIDKVNLNDDRIKKISNLNTKHYYNNNILITSSDALKCASINSESLDTILIIDEFDSLYDVLKSDLNFPTGESSNIIDAINNDNNVTDFIIDELMKDEINIKNIETFLNDNKYKNLQKLLNSINFCINNKYNYHYGFANDNKYNIFLATPYSHAFNPINGSQFSDIDILFIYTILCYKYSPIRTDDIYLFILDVIEKYKMFKYSYVSINPSIFIEKYSNNILQNIDIDMLSQKTPKELYHYVETIMPNINNKSKDNLTKFKIQYINDFILGMLKYYKTMLNASFIDIISDKFIKLKTGFSGTINIDLPIYLQNEHTFKNVIMTSEDEGAILTAMLNLTGNNLNDSVLKINSQDTNILENLVSLILPLNISCLIDVGAFFKEYKPEVVAKYILNHKLFRFKSIIFISLNDIQYNMYKDKNNNIVIEPYDNIMKNQVFIYYDNKHIVGTDIKNQPYKMKGIITINKYNKYDDIAQGSFRLRNMNYGHEIYFVLDDIIKNVVSRNDLVLYLLNKNKSYKKNSKYKLFLQNVLALNKIIGKNNKNELEQYIEYENLYKNEQEYLKNIIIKEYDNPIYRELCNNLIQMSNEKHDIGKQSGPLGKQSGPLGKQSGPLGINIQIEVQKEINVETETEIQFEYQRIDDNIEYPDMVQGIKRPTLNDFNDWNTIKECVAYFDNVPNLSFIGNLEYYFKHYKNENPIDKKIETKRYVDYNKYYIKYEKEDQYIILDDFMSNVLLSKLNFLKKNNNILIVSNKVVLNKNINMSIYDYFISLLFGDNLLTTYKIISKSDLKIYFIQILKYINEKLSILPWYSLDIINDIMNDKFDNRKYITLHFEKKIESLKNLINITNKNLHYFDKRFEEIIVNKEKYKIIEDIKLEYDNFKIIFNDIIKRTKFANLFNYWKRNISDIDTFANFVYGVYTIKEKEINKISEIFTEINDEIKEANADEKKLLLQDIIFKNDNDEKIKKYTKQIENLENEKKKYVKILFDNNLEINGGKLNKRKLNINNKNYV